MIARSDLRRIARARLSDSEHLYRTRRYDGAFYLCGYAVEVALKARICQTLKWPAFPETRGEFRDLQSFRAHDLGALLHLSGVEKKLNAQHLADWSIVTRWTPESRYRPIGSVTRIHSREMIDATRNLLRVL